jgi:hypothetical protein
MAPQAWLQQHTPIAGGNLWTRRSNFALANASLKCSILRRLLRRHRLPLAPPKRRRILDSSPAHLNPSGRHPRSPIHHHPKSLVTSSGPANLHTPACRMMHAPLASTLVPLPPAPTRFTRPACHMPHAPRPMPHARIATTAPSLTASSRPFRYLSRCATSIESSTQRGPAAHSPASPFPSRASLTQPASHPFISTCASSPRVEVSHLTGPQSVSHSQSQSHPPHHHYSPSFPTLTPLPTPTRPPASPRMRCLPPSPHVSQ